MKQNEVIVGNEYLCRVSNRMTVVKVLERVKSKSYGAYSRNVIRFKVAVRSTGKILPKLRSAAALR